MFGSFLDIIDSSQGSLLRSWAERASFRGRRFSKLEVFSALLVVIFYCYVQLLEVETVETSKQRSEYDPVVPISSIKAAFVYLGNEKHFGADRDRESCRSIYDSLKSLSLHFIPADDSSKAFPLMDLSVILLHDGELSNSTRLALTNASPFPLYFHEILFIQPRDEKWANESNVSYKRMCAFWFHYFFELDFLPDYVMRLDTDSCLVSDMDTNPFRYMYENQMEYMYHSVFHEPFYAVEDLQNFTSHHPGQSVNTATNNALTLWFPASMHVFSTNLEWFYIPAFRRPHILEWKDQVRHHGGVFRHRWGDAPLRTIVAANLFNSSRISRFCSFAYNHSSWGTLEACTQEEDFLVNKFGWRIVYHDPTMNTSVVA